MRANELYERLIFSFGLGDARVTVATIFAMNGCIALLFPLVAPKANRILYVGLTLLAFRIGFVLSYVILDFSAWSLAPSRYSSGFSGGTWSLSPSEGRMDSFCRAA